MKEILSKIQKTTIITKVYKKLPENPGVYIFFNNDTPIYIGKAINLRRRVASYFQINLEIKTAKMISEAKEIGYINVNNDFEALLLEAKLIRYYQPKYNVISKDDKHPLYIVITKEEFSKVITARKNDLNIIKSVKVFGPFPSSKNVKSVLKIIRRIVPFCDHNIGKRPCIYSQIGLCNPCPNEIVKSKQQILLKKKYLNNIRNIKIILEGNSSKLVIEFQKQMGILSRTKKYEEAAVIRNQIENINYIISPKLSIDSYLENPNFAEDLRDKELYELKFILNKLGMKLNKLKRIECFDVAHLQGASATASMITFVNGLPDKSYYRHFKIIQNKRQSDYDSMKELATRRKRHLNDWGTPDLMIVDGGKAQLSVFLKEFSSESIKVIGLAKRFETLVVPGNKHQSSSFIEYKLPKGPSLNLVQRIRNEAHRFAQSYHHKLFNKTLFESFT